MRTTDTLATATSSFYAELKRIKTILEAIQNTPRTFVILDEVLKGTNYRDQHVGIKALIKQMLSLNAHGLFATHDLNLGELAQQNPTQITNICFEVETHNNELSFDYKLKYGLTQSFNACQLMRNIGIEIDDELMSHNSEA
jgi:DNA mismatch repair ATPase MutS